MGKQEARKIYLDWDIDVIQHFCVVLHRGTGGEEDHDFLGQVAFQECEEQQEALLRRHDAVPLLQTLSGRQGLLVIHTHIQRLPLEREAGQVLYLHKASRSVEGHGA